MPDTPEPASVTNTIRPSGQYAGTPPTPPLPSQSFAGLSVIDCRGVPDLTPTVTTETAADAKPQPVKAEAKTHAAMPATI